MDHVVVFLDAEGCVLRWNPSAQVLFGYSEREIVDRHFSLFFTDEDRVNRLPERELFEAASTGWGNDENWLVRRDGSQFWATGVTVALPDGVGGVFAYAKVVTDMTKAHENEAAVLEARDRLRIALAAANMGVWRWDVVHDSHSRDENLNKMLGLSPEHPAMPIAGFLELVHSEDRTAVAQAFERSKRGRSLDLEFRVVHPNGDVRWLHDKGDAFGRWGGSPRYVTGACVDITERKQAQLELQRSREELEDRVKERTVELERAIFALQQEAAKRRAAQAARKELLRRVVTLQEEERQRIARELHDSVGQYVTALNLGVKAIKEQLGPNGHGREWTDKLSTLTSELGQEVHRISMELRPRSLDDVSLEGAIQQHLEAWSDLAKIPFEFHTQGLERLTPTNEIATTVYRVVQEALVNVAKHAEATRVGVVLEAHSDQLTVIVEDDGKGFEADRDRGVKGGTKRLGLLGMRERASLIGGDLEIESAPGNGTTVYLRVPIPRCEEGN
jgi:PAS domain S-box-containing protein